MRHLKRKTKTENLNRNFILDLAANLFVSPNPCSRPSNMTAGELHSAKRPFSISFSAGQARTNYHWDFVRFIFFSLHNRSCCLRDVRPICEPDCGAMSSLLILFFLRLYRSLFSRLLLNKVTKKSELSVGESRIDGIYTCEPLTLQGCMTTSPALKKHVALNTCVMEVSFPSDL